MSGGLFDNLSPERQRQHEADCARLEEKRALVAEIIDRAFRQELNEEFEADYIADLERHQAEIENYKKFCRETGLPTDFPAHPLDVAGYLLEAASNDAQAGPRAYDALCREHRRRNDFPDPMTAPAVRIVMRALRSSKEKERLH